jgi:restriction endonuclease Mrr
MSQVPGEQVVPPASPETDSSTTSELAPLQEEKLNQFADAYLAVEEIQNKAAAELERETDPVQAHEIEAQAETHMIQAVERTGLQLQEFNQIAEAASLNPELREVIIRRVEERRRI